MSSGNAPAAAVHLRKKLQAHGAAIKGLRDYSITGQSAKMRQQMLDDTFVLKDIAILGQWTTIYAAPNTGKTLITLWLLKEALYGDFIDGDLVFYVNADDNFKGLTDKTELAEKWGFHLIAPNQRGFKSSQITNLMIEIMQADEARGVVIILDTLKKFTNLMHKQEASDFGNIIREFISAGGTMIGLAHTNKHRSADGKPIYSGTSDIRDDSDCAFIIDKVDGRFFEDEVAIEFVNDKARGDVADKVSFSYSRKRGQTYAELVDTVKRLDEGRMEQLKSTAEVARKLEDDAGVITAVRDAINQKVTSKAAIIKHVNEETGIPQQRIRKTIFERTGTMYDLGDRWGLTVGARNKQVYHMLKPPNTPSCKSETSPLS